MSFPQYPKNHKASVLITPKQHLQAGAEQIIEFDAPNSVILCFEGDLMDYYRQMNTTTSHRFWTGELLSLGEANNKIALVGGFGIGGPAAAHMLEALIAMGIKKFVTVGHAGGLQLTNPIGSLVLVEKAIRDEGVSHHYADSERFAYPSQSLTGKLSKTLQRMNQPYNTGSSWTIDSMYRETMEEIAYYQSEGIDIVEMELASLFTVADFRKVDLAAVVVISDYIGGDQWRQGIYSKDTSAGLLSASLVAQKALLAK